MEEIREGGHGGSNSTQPLLMRSEFCISPLQILNGLFGRFLLDWETYFFPEVYSFLEGLKILFKHALNSKDNFDHDFDGVNNQTYFDVVFKIQMLIKFLSKDALRLVLKHCI